MDEITKLDKFVVSPFKQEIELEQVDYEAGFTSLRIKIRERSRFTIFDVDTQTAEYWGNALINWANDQKQKGDSK
ncbi:DUF6967 family protein [Sulfurirhabdus autotrophica]|uniref:Uncharacterized protein n=1 Tax=Sulfurirhabdus autotrophica TaxID=1706046 RepID=A0A4R3Y4L2_9PROT|nr:hypothetical protein [Sulfurirhabdus autotrophica]TCV86690.1 hypothetical protein EDC63_10651 [Sulfurirhabdus autotrophica]